MKSHEGICMPSRFLTAQIVFCVRSLSNCIDTAQSKNCLTQGVFVSLAGRPSSRPLLKSPVPRLLLAVPNPTRLYANQCAS